jgi:microcystin-dependent protein
MPADSYESVLGLLIMGTGNDNNAWGDNASNFVFKLASRAIGGTNTNATTSGTVDLSTVVPPAGARLDIDMIQNFTGALVGDLTVQVPAVSKVWLFRNNTTNNFNMYVKTTAGTAVQIPQGTSKWLYCDGTNVQRLDKEIIGDLVHTACATVQSGTLQCNGASLLRTAYPDLFSKIGTTWGSVDGTHFTLPDFVTNNRFLRAAGGSLAVATTQSNQNLAHTHTFSGALTVGSLAMDSQGAHQHNVYLKDPTHFHVQTGGGGSGNTGGGGAFGNNLSNANTNNASTGMTIGSVNGVANDNLTASAGAHTHTISGVPGLGTLATVSSGGSEARPENAAVLICIRY